MYKYLIRPLLFLLDPERAHYLATGILTFLTSFPGFSKLLRSLYVYSHPQLEKKLFGLTFKNPVGLAAGFDKDARWYNELANLGFGFIEIGTITPQGQVGNAKPRLFRIQDDHGLINRMGFNNQGAESAVTRLRNRKTNIIIGGNIGKNTETKNEDTIDDYIKNFEVLHSYVDYFVVNVSCPNIKGLTKLQDTPFLMKLLNDLKKINEEKNKTKPILLKIAPDLNDTQLDEIITIVRETGIDGVIATNTSISRDALITEHQRVEEIGNGGLSGLPIKKRSTEVIKYLSENSKKSFPIIGVGGIHSPEDAIEKLEAGADLVQVYTGFIYEGPSIIKRINKEIIKRYGKVG